MPGVETWSLSKEDPARVAVQQHLYLSMRHFEPGLVPPQPEPVAA